MTLGKAAAGVVHTGEGIYNIGFHGNDAVQFPARDLMDLLERWIDFCAEHEIQTNSVDYVEQAGQLSKMKDSL